MNEAVVPHMLLIVARAAWSTRRFHLREDFRGDAAQCERRVRLVLTPARVILVPVSTRSEEKKIAGIEKGARGRICLIFAFSLRAMPPHGLS
jgi:hypothetical protein